MECPKCKELQAQSEAQKVQYEARITALKRLFEDEEMLAYIEDVSLLASKLAEREALLRRVAKLLTGRKLAVHCEGMDLEYAKEFSSIRDAAIEMVGS